MDAATVYRPPHALDVRLTLSALRRGAGDPTHVVDATGVWRTALTPDGPATLHLSRPASGAVVAAAWGPARGGWSVPSPTCWERGTTPAASFPHTGCSGRRRSGTRGCA